MSLSTMAKNGTVSLVEIGVLERLDPINTVISKLFCIVKNSNLINEVTEIADSLNISIVIGRTNERNLKNLE